MPDNTFNLKVEYISPTALIIDEMGELPTLLVDELLKQDFKIYYFGKEPKDSFYYLNGKEKFNYLEDLEGVDFKDQVNYIFYFPSEFITYFGAFTNLVRNFSAKAIICSPVSFTSKKVFLNYLKNSDLKIKILFFDYVFGPRIKSGFLGQIFSQLIIDKKITIEGDSSEEIAPIFCKDLIKEAIRLIFYHDVNNKAFLLLPEEKITLLDFTSQIKNFLPDCQIRFSGYFWEHAFFCSDAEKIKIPLNLPEKVQETLEWFKRDFSVQKKNGEQLELEKTPSPFEIPQNFLEEDPTKTPKIEVQEVLETRSQSPETFNFSSQGSSSLPEKENLLSVPTMTNQDSSSPQKTKKTFFKKIFSKKFVHFFTLFFSFFLLIFVSPFLLSLGFNFWGIKKVNHSFKSFESGNFVLATKQANEAQKFLKFSEAAFNFSSPFYSLFGFEKQIIVLEKFFSFEKNLLSTFNHSLAASEKIADLGKKFLSGESVDWESTIKEARTDLNLAYEESSLAQSLINQVEGIFILFKQEETFQKIKSQLPQSREIFINGEKILSSLPKILSVGGIKNYLVLFQNNMELRPTGGFIGSYGILRLENGKLISFDIYDVYQADGQLKGHVEPPAELKKYLGEATWYLRDSNWDPDFPTSAQRAQWFLDKEAQISVDGTIALNLEAVKKALDALGEIEVSDYKEKINSQNLFQKAEYYSELGTFPGSTQKKEFLASLCREIFEKIEKSSKETFILLGQALLASLNQKDVLLYFNDEEVEKAIIDLHWEGAVRDFQPGLSEEEVLTDYLMLNEANVGINKANYYLKRDIDHEIFIQDDGRVVEKLTLSYENQSPSENWPAGRYKSYLRIYLKKGAILNSVYLTDPNDSNFWLPQDKQKIDVSEAFNKTVYGFVFEVPIKSKRKIEIDYEIPGQLKFSKEPKAFLLMVQKQSGAYPSIYNLTVSYPQGFIPLRVIPSAIVSEQKLLLSAKLEKDLIYQIDYSFQK